MDCRAGCAAATHYRHPQLAAEACRRCAWREPMPIDVDELLRLHDLLSLGLTVPVGRRTRWEEDALLLIDAEHAEQREARRKRP